MKKLQSNPLPSQKFPQQITDIKDNPMLLPKTKTGQVTALQCFSSHWALSSQ